LKHLLHCSKIVQQASLPSLLASFIPAGSEQINIRYKK